MTIRVVVADDQAVVRDGVVLLLGSAEDIEVVGQADNGLDAVDLAVRTRPDVVVVDLRMPGLDGTGVTERVLAAGIGARVLVLTTYADDDAVLPALRAGAAGYLTKDATGEAVLAAVRDVAARRTALDPAVQRRLVELVTQQQDSASPSVRRANDEPGASAGLTRREIDVLRLVAEGRNNRQVARDLVISEATVKTHLNHLLAKLALEDRGALIAWAWRNGLTSPPDYGTH